MRVMVLFDLPVLSDSERREYTRFRKFLIKSGFLMMQESVYVKLALNQTAAQSICEQVRRHKPAAGLVQMLTITEKQFQKMEMITGEWTIQVVCSDERILII